MLVIHDGQGQRASFLYLHPIHLMVKSLIASEYPVDREITGHLGSVAIRLRSVSVRSCTVEHQKQVRVSTEVKLHFRWQGTPYTIPVRVLRSRLGPLLGGTTGYHTTVEFVSLPGEVKTLIDRLLGRQLPPSIEPEHGTPEGIHA